MYPSYIPVRTVTLGGAMGMETANPLKVKVTIRSDKSLVWEETGFRFERVGYEGVSTAGGEIVILLPRTDVQGWRDPVTNNLVAITKVGQYSHRYTAEVSFLDETGVARGSSLQIGPFTVPGGALPLDLDKLVPVGTQAGEQVLIPNTWGAQLAAAQAAAQQAADALELMAGGTYLQKVRTGFYTTIDR